MQKERGIPEENVTRNVASNWDYPFNPISDVTDTESVGYEDALKAESNAEGVVQEKY